MARAARYNVIAAFPDETHADSAVRRLTSVGVRRSDMRVVRPEASGSPDRRAALRSEMQDEVTEGFGGPGIGLGTPAQAKGAFVGVAAGLLTGAVLGAAVGLLWIAVTHSAVSNPVRVVIAVVAFAVGGATAGFVAGGALKPRLDAERADPSSRLDERHLAAERGTVVALNLADEAVVDRAVKILSESGAERVDTTRPDGTPLPPQAEHPRPADPPGRWTNPGQPKG